MIIKNKAIVFIKKLIKIWKDKWFWILFICVFLFCYKLGVIYIKVIKSVILDKIVINKFVFLMGRSYIIVSI